MELTFPSPFPSLITHSAVGNLRSSVTLMRTALRVSISSPAAKSSQAVGLIPATEESTWAFLLRIRADPKASFRGFSEISQI